MQMAITFIAVVAGMVFSLAVALLVEEVIFGQVFRLLFASGQRTAAEVTSGKPSAHAAALKSGRNGG